MDKVPMKGAKGYALAAGPGGKDPPEGREALVSWMDKVPMKAAKGYP